MTKCIQEKAVRWVRRLAWMLAGALIGVVLAAATFCCLLDWGEKHVSRIGGQAVKANFTTLHELHSFFQSKGGHRIWSERGKDLQLLRYRFLYGEDIDVIIDGNRRIIEIYPTFAVSWGRPWPLIHRARWTQITLPRWRVAETSGTVASRAGDGF